MSIDVRSARAALAWTSAVLLALTVLLVMQPLAAHAAASVQVDGWGGWMETHSTDTEGEHSNEGDVVVYQLKVTNTGSKDLSRFSVTDDRVSGQGLSWACSQQTLRPGDAMFCYADGDYRITAAENEVGKVVTAVRLSAASASSGRVTANPFTQTVNLGQTNASIFPAAAVDTLVEPSDNNSNGTIDAGDTITYSFIVTNVSASAVGNISGGFYPKFDGDGPQPEGEKLNCPQNSLQPRKSMRCTIAKPYTVTSADERAGSVDSIATVDGSSEAAPNGVLSHEDAASIATKADKKRNAPDPRGADREDPKDRESDAPRHDGVDRDRADSAPPIGSDSEQTPVAGSHGFIPAAAQFLTSPKTVTTASAALGLALAGLLLARRRTTAARSEAKAASHRADRSSRHKL